MTEDRDRTELRDDLPEDVQHPNETGPSGPSLAVVRRASDRQKVKTVLIIPSALSWKVA